MNSIFSSPSTSNHIFHHHHCRYPSFFLFFTLGIVKTFFTNHCTSLVSSLSYFSCRWLCLTDRTRLLSGWAWLWSFLATNSSRTRETEWLLNVHMCPPRIIRHQINERTVWQCAVRVKTFSTLLRVEVGTWTLLTAAGRLWTVTWPSSVTTTVWTALWPRRPRWPPAVH